VYNVSKHPTTKGD